MHDQLVHAGKLDLSEAVRIYDASSLVGQSTRAAYAEARSWLENLGIDTNRSSDEPPPDDGQGDR